MRRILCGFAVWAAIIAAVSMLSASPTLAQCVPAAGAGTPPAGTTVTCSGTTTNQNNPDGYGDSSQSGLTISVISGVRYRQLTFNFNDANADRGIIKGASNGIEAQGSVTVNNSSTGIISSRARLWKRHQRYYRHCHQLRIYLRERNAKHGHQYQLWYRQCHQLRFHFRQQYRYRRLLR